jgi:hypothetical protein
MVFADEAEAKSMVHAFAHLLFQSKDTCDCAAEPSWESPIEVERRRLKRFDYPCQVWAGPKPTKVGRMANLNAQGAFIRTSRPLAVGSVLSLRFPIGHIDIVTQGEVVHSIPRQGMGVRFLDLDETDRSLIDEVTGLEG